MNPMIRTFGAPTMNSAVRRLGISIKDWGVRDVELMHNDFKRIQQIKNDQFQLPFVMTEIPPPFCPRCCKHVKNKCLLSPYDDIGIDDFDLAENVKLIIRCPIFGEVSTIFDNDAFDETSYKKDD